MHKTVEQLLEIADEIDRIKIQNCGPSDDPDKQYAYAATFRDLLIRFVSLAKRLNDPIIDELLENVNDNIETGYISDAHYQRARIVPIIDYLNEIKDNAEYGPNIAINSIFVDLDILNKIKIIKPCTY